jgi:hypothetical protein
MRYYFDPIRSLTEAAAREWAAPDARDTMLARLAAPAQPAVDPMVVNGARIIGPSPQFPWGTHMTSRPIMENERRA